MLDEILLHTVRYDVAEPGFESLRFGANWDGMVAVAPALLVPVVDKEKRFLGNVPIGVLHEVGELLAVLWVRMRCQWLLSMAKVISTGCICWARADLQ